jgi:hypothetical protein
MYVYVYIHTIHTCRAILAPLVDVRLVGRVHIRSPHIMRLAHTVCTHSAAARSVDVETTAISPSGVSICTFVLVKQVLLY